MDADTVVTSPEPQSVGSLLLAQIPQQNLAELITNNSNLRSVIQGYIAEFHLENYLRTLPGVTEVKKIPDNDKKKGDFSFRYNGREVTIESKSLRTGSSREDFINGGFTAVAELKSSDTILLEDGRRTNCLPPGQFDILAISTYGFNQKWEFYFIHNRYLPESSNYEGLLQTRLKLNILSTPCLYTDLMPVLQDLD